MNEASLERVVARRCRTDRLCSDAEVLVGHGICEALLTRKGGVAVSSSFYLRHGACVVGLAFEAVSEEGLLRAVSLSLLSSDESGEAMQRVGERRLLAAVVIRGLRWLL